MELLSSKLNFDQHAPDVPPALLQEASRASRIDLDPRTAQAVYEKLSPIIGHFKSDPDFASACGLLIEKQRRTEGMLDFWSDLNDVFPENITPFRMMMRWFRRQRRQQEGVSKMHALFPKSHSDLDQAEKAIIGFAELRAFPEIDDMMTHILVAHPDARSIRMRYIKVLNQQSRFLDANDVATTIQFPEKMGVPSQLLLETVARRARKLAEIYEHDASDVFERLIDLAPKVRETPSTDLGGITFFTGQLGAGGAERQLTRLASAFQRRYQTGQGAGGMSLTAPIDVAVRHADTAAGADFFLPDLHGSAVGTTILSEKRQVNANDLSNIAPEVLNLLELLPQDVHEHTLKLIPYFRSRNTQVAYLWQDGAILVSALAALLAPVERIITSFRGLPPNLRPSLDRPELAHLYKGLARLPQVTFSANSQSTAIAYEEWLSLDEGTVAVIPNASPPVLPHGSAEDFAQWSVIRSKSPGCSKTVLGVFRFDENKRPLMWIEAAARFAVTNADTRFVVVGTGYLFNDCVKRIAELGLSHRIFCVGLQSSIGFWMHKADLMMHLARMEGLPNVLIEAQLAGVPVLATPAGGTNEVVSHGETGCLLSTAQDPTVREIVNTMNDMLNDPATLTKMGELAKERATPRFLIDSVIDQTARLFLPDTSEEEAYTDSNILTFASAR